MLFPCVVDLAVIGLINQFRRILGINANLQDMSDSKWRERKGVIAKGS